MKVIHPAILVCLGFLLGAPSGWFAGRGQISVRSDHPASTTNPGAGIDAPTASPVNPSPLVELGDALRPLQAIRKGDIAEATEWLESRLDGQVIELSGLVPEEADQKKRAGYLRALTRVRDYRTAYPRKSDSPDLDRGVADALSTVEKGGGKK